jgi:hypothetical protein
MRAAVRRLHDALAWNNRLASRLDSPGFPMASFYLLQDWQRERLKSSFADLADNPRYRAANEFFLTELYGGLNFRKRDRDVEKVMPVMTRMLPDPMQATLAEALELQALSLEFDIDMAEIVAAQERDFLDVEAYGEVYRCLGRREERERQIGMIRHLGLELDRFVRKPLVLWLIRIVRGPAHAAGFGALQTFLENGLSAFSNMKSASEFIDIIETRETRSMQRLFEAHPRPFQPENVHPKCSLR